MKLGDVLKFDSDQATGYQTRQKLHIFVGTTDHFRAPDEFVFLYISSSNYGGCYPIAQAKYAFLNYDSHISCDKLIFYSREYLQAIGLNKVGAIAFDDLKTLHRHIAGHDQMVGWQITVTCEKLKIVL